MPSRLALITFALASPLAQAATPASTPRFEFAIGGSATGDGDADFAGRTFGSIETSSIRGSFQFRAPLGETLRYHLGAGFEQFTIDATSGVPVPERLQSQFVELGAAWSLTPAWSLSAAVQPGLYGDTEVSTGDAFTAPVTLFALWRPDGPWTLAFGARYHPFGRNELLPFLSARWQISDAWSLALGAPRTEIAFVLDRQTTFFAGASFEGGTFAIDDPALVAPAGYPQLRDTKLDYREIRAGLGVRRQLSPDFRLQLEAGAAVDRRFDYFDRNLEIEAGSAGFVGLSVVGTF